MKISFDLDGVIATSDRHFFRMLNALRTKSEWEVELTLAELDYYSNRPLKMHPNDMLAPQDQGYIITSRKPLAKAETENWLCKHGITTPVIYADSDDILDWTDYPKASTEAASLKAAVISSLGVAVHFDNNPYIVRELRVILPNVTIIQVGREIAEN